MTFRTTYESKYIGYIGVQQKLNHGVCLQHHLSHRHQSLPLPFHILCDKTPERVGISPFLSHRPVFFNFSCVFLLCSRFRVTMLVIILAAISLTSSTCANLYLALAFRCSALPK